MVTAIEPTSLVSTPIASIGCCSRLKEVGIVVAKIAIRVFFVMGSLIASAALFPASLHFFALPLGAVSAAVISSRFFSAPQAIDSSETHLFTQNMISNEPNAPRGLRNAGNNCWANSNVHFLDSDPLAARWLRNIFPSNMNMADFEQFLTDHNAPLALINHFRNYVANHQNPPASPADHFRAFLREGPPQGMIGQIFEDLFTLSEPFSRFFEAYDQALQNNTEVAADSQTLRLALNQICALIPTGPEQVDAAEPLTFLLALLPMKQKMRIEEAYRYNTRGLPRLRDFPDSLSRKEESATIISLEFTEGHESSTTLEKMFKYYCDHDMEVGNEVVRTGVDGRDYRYPVDHATRRFLEAPPSLRFQIKRFYNIPPPKSWLTRLFPRWFPEQQYTLVKRDIPVSIPPELEIDLPNGQKAKYKLVSFVNHHGSSVDSGHYTAARIANGEKYFISDQIVTKPSQQEWDDRLSHAYFVSYIPC